MGHFIPSSVRAPDPWFTFTFLVTHRLFLKPHELLQTISARVEGLLSGEKAAEVAQRLLQLLRTWTDACVGDFRDPRMMEPLKVATDKISSLSQECKALVRASQKALLDALKAMEAHEAKIKKEFDTQMKVKRETLSQSGTLSASGKGISALIPDCGAAGRLALRAPYHAWPKVPDSSPDSARSRCHATAGRRSGRPVGVSHRRLRPRACIRLTSTRAFFLLFSFLAHAKRYQRPVPRPVHRK